MADPERKRDLHEAGPIDPEKPLQIRVLVIDDHPVAIADILKGIQKNLGEHVANFFDVTHGGDVRIIQDFGEASDAAKSSDFDYDLVLLDNNLEHSSFAQPDELETAEAQLERLKFDPPFVLIGRDLISSGHAYSLAKQFEAKGALVIGTSGDHEGLKKQGVLVPAIFAGKPLYEFRNPAFKPQLLEALKAKREEKLAKMREATGVKVKTAVDPS